MYLGAADYTMKKLCGIYEIEDSKGRISYKIYAEDADLLLFWKKNKDKVCKHMLLVFFVGQYRDYSNTKVKKINNG